MAYGLTVASSFVVRRCRQRRARLLLALACALLGVLCEAAGGGDVESLGAESPPAVRAMLEWLVEGGASWSEGLRIRDVGSGERGLASLVARRQWQRDLFTVPLSRTISSEVCRLNASSFVARLPDAMRSSMGKSHSLLHLCFLEHYLLLREASPFAPYLEVLPKSLGHLPLVTTLNISELLAGSPLVTEVAKHRRDLESLYDEIGWELKDFRDAVQFDDFMFTYCLVESHSHARHEGNDTLPLMVPLLDLINHRSVDESLRIGWGGPDQLVVHVTKAGAQAGDELFFSYSQEQELSSRFFVQFGFVDDALTIGAKVAFPLQPSHPHYKEKRLLFDDGLVKMKMMFETDFSRFVSSDSKVMYFPKFFIWHCNPASGDFAPQRPQTVREELLPFARFVVYDGELDTLKESCDTSVKPPLCHSSLGPGVERLAAEFLLSVAQEHLMAYGGDAGDADDARLAAMAPGTIEAPYVRVHRDEQRCLGTLVADLEALRDSTDPLPELDAPQSSSPEYVDYEEVQVDDQDSTVFEADDQDSTVVDDQAEESEAVVEELEYQDADGDSTQAEEETIQATDESEDAVDTEAEDEALEDSDSGEDPGEVEDSAVTDEVEVEDSAEEQAEEQAAEDEIDEDLSKDGGRATRTKLTRIPDDDGPSDEDEIENDVDDGSGSDDMQHVELGQRRMRGQATAGGAPARDPLQVGGACVAAFVLLYLAYIAFTRMKGERYRD